MRKGNVFLICICSRPLQCTQFPLFFLFLGLPDCTGHAGLGTGKASALRLVSVTAAFFLCCTERGKSPTAERLSRGAQGSLRCFCKELLLQGSRAPASGLRTRGHPWKGQRQRVPRAGPHAVHPAGIRAGAPLRCAALAATSAPACRHPRHPAWIRSSANH